MAMPPPVPTVHCCVYVIATRGRVCSEREGVCVLASKGTKKKFLERGRGDTRRGGGYSGREVEVFA